jgi:hypothetical protein
MPRARQGHDSSHSSETTRHEPSPSMAVTGRGFERRARPGAANQRSTAVTHGAPTDNQTGSLSAVIGRERTEGPYMACKGLGVRGSNPLSSPQVSGPLCRGPPANPGARPAGTQQLPMRGRCGSSRAAVNRVSIAGVVSRSTRPIGCRRTTSPRPLSCRRCPEIVLSLSSQRGEGWSLWGTPE